MRHQRAERIAALFEIPELVIGGAGRRQQHHGRACGTCGGVGGGGFDRALQRAAQVIDRLAVQSARKFMCRLPDQIGFADAGEIGRQDCDAAFLGLAAGIQ